VDAALSRNLNVKADDKSNNLYLRAVRGGV
jgi:hypothetical protein